MNNNDTPAAAGFTKEGFLAYFGQMADENGQVVTTADWLADMAMLIVHEGQPLATGQRHEDARDDAGDVAAEIAKILFTSGDGRTANRLIMEFETTIGGTGWIQRAVALKVAELLQASRQPAAGDGD